MKNFSWLAAAGVTIAALAVFVLATPARALSVGDAAPDFTADSALNGKVVKFSLKDALAQHAVVLYFFPKAFTSG
jgi:thioredoxin-dependent peroxiredoxin